MDVQRSNHLIQTYVMGLLRPVQVLSKGHTRYFQNEEFALCISRVNESTKYSFHMWVSIYKSNLLRQDMS